MARVIAEQRFKDPFTDEQYVAFAKMLDPCLEVRNGAWRRSALAGDRMRMICEFEAPDAEAVREAFRASAIPFDSVWSAEVFAVEDYPEPMKKLATLLGDGPGPAVPAAAPDGSNDEATAAWNGVLFDKFVRFKDVLTRGFARHSDAALRRVPLAAGASVLDVGCGFGDVTAVIANEVGPSGVATGVDVADRFVEAARGEADKRGLANARFVRADAQKDDLGGPYDTVFSRFGTMFFASPVIALRNMHDALRPGGALCIVVWRKREDNDWVHVGEKVVRDLVRERHDSNEPTCGPGPFSMAGADTTSDILLRSGFRDIAFFRSDAPVRIGRDIDEAIAFAMALGPAGEILRLAGEEGERRRPAVTASLRKAFAGYSTSDGVMMGSSAWIITARA